MLAMAYDDMRNDMATYELCKPLRPAEVFLSLANIAKAKIEAIFKEIIRLKSLKD